MARQPTEFVQFKLRLRQPLLKKIQKEAAKKKVSANVEAVERLEQSFESDPHRSRDGAIIDMLVRSDEASAQLLSDLYDGIAKHPDWSNDEAGRKYLLGWLAYAIHGKTPQGEPQPGDDQ
jgi:hypothetical protein